jgi:type II secretory pathway pseudopilin PulG
MKTKYDRNLSGPALRRANGMTLLDVLLAIVIFAVGMLALASLQGNLTRSSADANSRTVAANLAEEILEQMRTYEQLASAADVDAYQDIATHTRTETRGGIDYTVDITVEDWYFLPNGEDVTKDTGDLPSGQDTTISSFKNVILDVSWTGNEFQIGDGTATTGRLGSGSFAVSGIIASVPTMGAARVAAEDDGELGTPQVTYTPGEAPDIMAVRVGDGKFKESTTPEPVVRRRDKLVETWFDVITYNTALNPNIFIRREEFVAISCECEIKASGPARLPTIWTGVEYQEGELVTKTYGVQSSKGKQQSQYCDVCCRDHHDTSASGLKYRPTNSSSSSAFSGNHPHYDRVYVDGVGAQWVEAVADGDTYLEACRLVRKDGFFRVAQDFDLNEINVFPENYLTVSQDVSNYSNYVRGIANKELGGYDTGLTATAQPANAVLTFDGNSVENLSEVPSADSVALSTQLQSRGIYVDYLNNLLRDTLDNCFGDGSGECEAPDATSPYELYPFFDVQVTHLATWSENKPNCPIDISNEALDGLPDTQSNEALCAQGGQKCYSRGRAEIDEYVTSGRSAGVSTIETGNAGLISTLPITASPTPAYDSRDLYLSANGGTELPDCVNPVISGVFNNESDTSDPAIAILEGSPDRVDCSGSLGTFQCVLPPGFTGTATLTITNYQYPRDPLNPEAPIVDLYVCSNNSVLTPVSYKIESVHGFNEAVFALPNVTTGDASITITQQSCQ